MATFKVGQRVRVVAIHPKAPRFRHLLGQEGVIDEAEHPHHDFPETLVYGVTVAGGEYLFGAEHLAPLTDPLADAFIERIKKLEPLR